MTNSEVRAVTIFPFCVWKRKVSKLFTSFSKLLRRSQIKEEIKWHGSSVTMKLKSQKDPTRLAIALLDFSG